MTFFTEKSARESDWLIDIETFLPEKTNEFKQKAQQTDNLDELFASMKAILFENLPQKDFSIISKAIDLIEKEDNSLQVKDISQKLEVRERILRNYFYQYVGCSPKEYLQIIKIQQIAKQLDQYQDSLLNITYQNDFFDPLHFNKEIKNITYYRTFA